MTKGFLTLNQTSYIVVAMMPAGTDIHLVYFLVILMCALTDHAWKISLRFP